MDLTFSSPVAGSIGNWPDRNNRLPDDVTDVLTSLFVTTVGLVLGSFSDPAWALTAYGLTNFTQGGKDEETREFPRNGNLGELETVERRLGSSRAISCRTVWRVSDYE